MGGVLGLQCGAVLTTRLYPAVGPGGVVTVRLCLAALVLVAPWRPRIRADRSALGIIATAGTLLALHHLAYYEAVDRLPLGAVTTLEFLGPFVIALCGSWRLFDLLWACLAATVWSCSAIPARPSTWPERSVPPSPGAAGAYTSW
ncbi:hypothetical protein [Streptomyces durhamensis]|uniref:hypothetical protein n=1 Tax=Streptomyces durhamensis TaxID=68194 RepID=UPI0006906B8C|nr:hypothetical protein [Streptomyces durhamensis]